MIHMTNEIHSFVWTESEDGEDYSDRDEGSPKNTEFECTVKQSLIEWAVGCNIPRCHVTNLLNRLHNHAKLTFLPLDSRTLLSSKRGKIQLREMRPGKSQHFDIVASLLKLLAAMEFSETEIPDVLYMLANVDGIPLSKSSSSDFWPILLKIQGWDDIFVGGIYHVSKKPACINEFLSAFRDDVVRLRTDGLQYQGKNIKVILSGISCDAPATSFVLNIKTHTAYYACRKCTTRGLWVGNTINHYSQAKTAGRVTYPELNAPLRTDNSFRNRLQAKHHNDDGRRSIIEDILVDVVEDVVLDYMHLVCIGVRKKDLTEWISGKFDRLRFSNETITNISSYLIGIGVYN